MADGDPGPGSDEGSHQDWRKRREALAAKLAQQRARLDPASAAPSSGGMKGAADGMKLASEFVAGILAGAGIGYLLDRLVGTGPFGLVVFLILGFVAGVLNVLRSVGKTGGPAPAPDDAKKDGIPPGK